jgi:uncharacterized membrane protein
MTDRAEATSRGLARRSFLLGWACGGRTSYGPAALELTSSKPATGWRKRGRLVAVLSACGEAVLDKLPSTPSRLQPLGLGGRIASGTGSAGALAARNDEAVWVPAALGAAGAAAGSYAGAAWRSWAGRRWPDWRGALAEDVVTILIARYATRPE